MDTVPGPTGKKAGQERKFRVFSLTPSMSPANNHGCIHKVNLQSGLKSGVLNQSNTTVLSKEPKFSTVNQAEMHHLEITKTSMK